jgi:hypothetical protein
MERKDRMKIGNIIFQKILKKNSFHIPNNKHIKWLVKKLFKIRIIRGRGPRVKWALKENKYRTSFQSSLPLKYATYLHIYLPNRDEKGRYL